MHVTESLEEPIRLKASIEMADRHDRVWLGIMLLWILICVGFGMALPVWPGTLTVLHLSLHLLLALILSCLMREGIRLFFLRMLGCRDAHLEMDHWILKASSTFCMSPKTRCFTLLGPDFLSGFILLMLMLAPPLRGLAFLSLALHGLFLLTNLRVIVKLRKFPETDWTFAHAMQVDLYETKKQAKIYRPGQTLNRS